MTPSSPARLDQPLDKPFSQTRNPWREALRRMLRSPATQFGALIVVVLIGSAIFAPLVSPYSPINGNINTSYVKPPSIEHLFGTDDVGRDILSRIIYGARISLSIALSAQALGLAIGVTLGLLTGFYGGWLDNIVMRIVDIVMAFPLLIIAIAMVTALGPGEQNILIALAIVIWPNVTRLVRSQTLALREAEYVSAARVIGVTDWGIMFRHILPNLLTPLVVVTTLGLANIILQEAALSFLGLGTANSDTPSWGKMLNESRSFIRAAPWMSFYPGLIILLAVLGFNLLGDGLRDALDVQSR